MPSPAAKSPPTTISSHGEMWIPGVSGVMSIAPTWTLCGANCCDANHPATYAPAA